MPKVNFIHQFDIDRLTYSCNNKKILSVWTAFRLLHNYNLSDIKVIWCTFSGSRFSLLLERSNPSFENTLSVVTEVAGMARYFLASLESRGYFPSFPFQKSPKGSMVFLRLTSLQCSAVQRRITTATVGRYEISFHFRNFVWQYMAQDTCHVMSVSGRHLLCAKQNY